MLSRILAALKAHWNRAEIVSLIQTFLGFLTVDAALQFQRVLGGDLTEDALAALAVAIARSLVKAVWAMIVAATKKYEQA